MQHWHRPKVQKGTSSTQCGLQSATPRSTCKKPRDAAQTDCPNPETLQEITTGNRKRKETVSTQSGLLNLSISKLLIRRPKVPTPTAPDCCIRICSIDPLTARDLDDALSVEPLPGDGGWRVGVHIADVAHFVAAGSALDGEALGRGTSVYMVDRVIPMLPRLLCEELCSLNPGGCSLQVLH